MGRLQAALPSLIGELRARLLALELRVLVVRDPDTQAEVAQARHGLVPFATDVAAALAQLDVYLLLGRRAVVGVETAERDAQETAGAYQRRPQGTAGAP